MKVVLMEIWSHGGTAHYAAELAQGLSESGNAGDEVHLIVPKNFGPSETEGVSQVHFHKVLPELRGLRVGGKVGGALGLSWFRWRQIAATTRLIRQLRPDIVHVLSMSNLSRKLLRQIWRVGAKSVLTVHDLPVKGGGATQAFYRMWCRHFTRANRIIVHGPWSLSQIEARSGAAVARRTIVMPHGPYDYGTPTAEPEELRRRFALPESGHVLLFFGSLRRNKGLEVLIEAMGQSKSQNLHLLVAGQQPSQNEPSVEWYQTLAREQGVEYNITWLIRFIENEEVSDLFACSDVAVLPYKRTFAAQSGVLCVAAACDVPVIASDVGDMGAMVRLYNLGRCVEPESVEELSAVLSELDSNCLEWGERKTRQFAEDASWENIGRRLWALYRDLAPQKGERKTV